MTQNQTLCSVHSKKKENLLLQNHIFHYYLYRYQSLNARVSYNLHRNTDWFAAAAVFRLPGCSSCGRLSHELVAVCVGHVLNSRRRCCRGSCGPKK